MFGNEFKNRETVQGLTVAQTENSLLLVARREIILPTKQILLVDDAEEEEKQILRNLGLLPQSSVVTGKRIFK